MNICKHSFISLDDKKYVCFYYGLPLITCHPDCILCPEWRNDKAEKERRKIKIKIEATMGTISPSK